MKTVDTTGAGDAFVGALLAAVASDASIFEDKVKLKEALTLANVYYSERSTFINFRCSDSRQISSCLNNMRLELSF